MQKFEIELNLEAVCEAKRKAAAAQREFGLRINKAMTRLIHEAAAQRMSVAQVAKLSGFSTAQVKARMKAMNLNPTTGKTLLSKQAADVLASNAEIMGIEPREIDLMSPLAYLPAGSLLKDKAQSKGVTDLDEAFPETDLTPEERAGIEEAAAMYGPTNGDLITLINVLLGQRARQTNEADETPTFPETVTTGYWCRECGFFEEDFDPRSTAQEPCDECGCGVDAHRLVTVVAQADEAGA